MPPAEGEMTSVLDCSSLDTVLDSASGLLGMSVPQFREALACLEIDWDHHTLAPEDQVARRFGHEDRRNLPAPSAIRWFHATRAHKGTMFEEGILPTPQALPKLWASLGNVATQWGSAEEWAEYQRAFAQ